jgi:hypothetical protein
VIRRGVSGCEGALFRSVLIGKAMVCTLDRAGIEKAMGEAWVARFHRLACEHAPEGIVSKRINGRYEPDRRSWLKTKCLNREEFVVVGWSDPEGSRHRIGALLLGYYTPAGDLVYAGRACTGLPERELERLWQRLQPLVSPRCHYRHHRLVVAVSARRSCCPASIGCDPKWSSRSRMSSGRRTGCCGTSSNWVNGRTNRREM